MFIDLHIHSTYSDGTVLPGEIVERAAQIGLKAVAITDHDTVEGYAEAAEVADKYDMEVIAGIEISCTHKGNSLHILGYGLDPEFPLLRDMLAHLQRGREKRNRGIIARLNKIGINISEQELAAVSVCGQTGRPHIGSLLVNKGKCISIDEAFSRYLARGKVAYVERFSFSARETIDVIHAAGGVAVFAHPGQMPVAKAEMAQVVKELTKLGLDGLEVYYPPYTNKTRKRLLALARKHQLLVTGGSDYHGANRCQSTIGGAVIENKAPAHLLVDLYEKIGCYSNNKDIL